MDQVRRQGWASLPYRVIGVLPQVANQNTKRLYSMKVKMLTVQLCLTLCNSMDFSPPGSSVRGILQARILEWVDIPFSRGSSQLKDQTQVSCLAGRFLTV